MSEDCTLFKLTLKILQLIDSVNRKKIELEDSLQDGYFNLSKSKYTMGVNQVSSLQYPQHMEPQITVECMHSKTSASTTYSLKTVMESQKLDKDQEIQKSSVKPQLRRRTNKTTDNNTNEKHGDEPKSKSVEKMSDDKENKPKLNKQQQDPLNWFGILLPSTLRQAKSSFVDALKISCEICSLNSQLETWMDAYRQLTESETDDSEPCELSKVTESLTNIDISSPKESDSTLCVENIGARS